MAYIRVHWITKYTEKSLVSQDVLASVRFRLGAALSCKRLAITTGFIIPDDTEILVWPKFSWVDDKSTPVLKNNIAIADRLTTTKIVQVLDYTDHHLHPAPPPKSGRSLVLNDIFSRQAENNRNYYRAMMERINYVSVPTNSMKLALNSIGVKKPIWVIPDAIDFQPALIPAKSTPGRTAFWYGSHFSFQQLVTNLRVLENSLTSPLVLNCLVAKATLKNITNGHYDIPSRKFLTIKVTPWSLEKMLPFAVNSDFIFLPSSLDDPRRALASSNRLISAFSLARPVIATPIPSYDEYRNHFIPFPSETADLFLRGGSVDIPDIHKNKQLAQNFYAENISMKWEEMFYEIRRRGTL